MSWSSSTLEINAAYLFNDLLDIRFRDSFYRLRVRALAKAKTLNALCSHLVKSLSSWFRWPTILSRLLASMVVSPLSNAYDYIDYQFIYCRWPKQRARQNRRHPFLGNQMKWVGSAVCGKKHRFSPVRQSTAQEALWIEPSLSTQRQRALDMGSMAGDATLVCLFIFLYRNFCQNIHVFVELASS